MVIGDGVDVDTDVELLEIITEEGAPESVDVLILAPAMVTFEEVLVTEAKLSDKAAATASLVKGADEVLTELSEISMSGLEVPPSSS